MKKYILSLAFLLLTSPAWSGAGVCHDGSGNITEYTLDGDWVFFTQTDNCKYYKDAEFEQLKSELIGVPKKYIKWDNGLDKPVEMTQAEKDAVDQAIADAKKQAEIERAERLDFTMQDVIVALVKRINTRIPNDPITKQEIIDQLKADKGLD